MFLSLKERKWECRAMENFLIMWEDIDITDTCMGTDEAEGGAVEMSSLLRSILNANQISTIEDYFKFRASAATSTDEDGAKAFVASLCRAQ